MTDLNDMMVFRQVVEQGSFTAAANEIGLPKSNISRKISRLETGLQAKLLERSTRSLNLTEVGRIFYDHCVRIADEVASAQECIETLSHNPKGWIKLCTSLTLGQTLISPHLAKFSEQYPDVHLDINLTNRRVDVIEEGFDLIIRVGESPDSNLITKRLTTVKLALFASRGYVEKHKVMPIKNPDDLQLHSCLYMNARNEKHRWHLSNSERQIHLDITPSMLCNDFATLQQMALSDMGIALLPEYLCKAEVTTGNLQRVLPDWDGRKVNLYAIYPSRKGATPKIRAFIDYLAQQLN
ncbi:LysR family transcriptional regulator [Thalassotalea fonticola]|uniref:LysR family transcriptional regulator n=1 Tax=Thalassotalea fonticola TaxID=3065649 RepID=A0ABZ0GK13_9GAMM|nr:LysR family transcriptional regulator [Colwelliaceae bacterium S1-1]